VAANARARHKFLSGPAVQKTKYHSASNEINKCKSAIFLACSDSFCQDFDPPGILDSHFGIFV
jgi:hypothetical protein